MHLRDLRRRALWIYVTAPCIVGTASCSTTSAPTAPPGSNDAQAADAGPADAAGADAFGADVGPADASSRDVQTTDAGLDTCPRGTAYADGCPMAPRGTPQVPTLLQSYCCRAPWNVAGVDFAVGIPNGTTLKDPFPNGVLAPELTALGGTASSHVVFFNGVDNIVIDGWDFAAEGGWSLQLNGNNATVQNCNFKIGANKGPFLLYANGSPNNLTIRQNVFDGAEMEPIPAGGLLMLNAQGTTSIEYNLIRNSYYQFIQAGPGPGGSATTQAVRFNVFQNAGYGAPNGAHGDWIQDFGSSGDVWNGIVIDFNTFIQDAPAAATQGLSIFYSGGQFASALAVDMSNNTVVVRSNVNYAFLIDTSWLDGSATEDANYVDPTGIVGNWTLIQNTTTGPYNGNVSHSGNANMVTGTPLP